MEISQDINECTAHDNVKYVKIHKNYLIHLCPWFKGLRKNANRSQKPFLIFTTKSLARSCPEERRVQFWRKFRGIMSTIPQWG